jgi:hypothetical protein
MMQSRHVAGEASLSRSSLLPVASSLYPAFGPQRFWPSMVWPRQQWRFFGIAMVSFPTLHWHHCQHQAVLVASFVPALLPIWPSKVWPVQCWHLLALRWRFTRIALASLPALCCCHHCRRCAGIVALGTWSTSPSSTPLVVVFALPPSLPYMASSPYLVSTTPVLCFLLPDALAAMHVPFAMTLLSERLMAAATVLVMTIPPGNSGVCCLELFLLSHPHRRQHH